MSRSFIIGETVIDQFPVFEPDGYTKKSGETVFAATLWVDGVVEAGVPVTITEIDTSGEYRVEFTPDALGFWALEVLIDYNKDIVFGEYSVQGGFACGSPFDPEGVLP